MLIVKSSTSVLPIPVINAAAGMPTTYQVFYNGAWTVGLGSISGTASNITVTPTSTETGTLGPFMIQVLDVTTVVIGYISGNVVAWNPNSSAVNTNVTAINSVATTSVTTINANIGTTVAITFDANNFQKVDLVDIAGVTVSTTTAQLGVNAVKYNNQVTQTDGNNLPKVDIVDIAGSAVATGSAQLGVNLVNIAGSAVATGTAQLGVNVVNIAGTASAGTAGYVGIDWGHVNAPTTTVNLSNTTVYTVTAVTGQLTAAQIATGVWQDTTSGDFTTTGSPGKILVGQLGGTFTTTTSSVFTAASLVNTPGIALAAAAVATAVWKDLLSSPDFLTAGSIGALLAANIPLLNGAQITSSSPVAQNGNFSVVSGCSYYTIDGPLGTLEFTDNAGTWPNLLNATACTFTVFNRSGTSYTAPMAFVLRNVTNQVVKLELSASQTAAMYAGNFSGQFSAVVVLQNGHSVELFSGSCSVTQT